MVATAALGAGVVVACQSSGERAYEPPRTRVVQPGAPGQSGRTLSPDELRKLSPPGYNAADTRFMQRMIHHHAQALQMTGLVQDRAQSRDLPLLAGRIEASQRDEITRMEQWLKERGTDVPNSHTDHAMHGEPMPGMLTPEQLTQLQQARGVDFDRLFLRLMVQHHEGALVMVRELYATGGGLEPAADRFAREVEADQEIEIRRMGELLAKLG